MIINSIISKLFPQARSKKQENSKDVCNNPIINEHQEVCSTSAALAAQANFIASQSIQQKQIFYDPMVESLGQLGAKLAKIKPETISDILESDSFNAQEKEKLQAFYSHFKDLGYQNFIDTHPGIFYGMALSSFDKNSTLDYGKIEKNEFKLIVDAAQQLDSGRIKPEWISAAKDRMQGSAPYSWLKYIDDFDSIPPEGLANDFNQQCIWDKGTIISVLTHVRNLVDCIDTQSTNAPVKATRVDHKSVFKNALCPEDLSELIQNGEKDKVLEILNNPNAPIKFKYDNFIGTTIDCKNERRVPKGSVLWHIDIPEGTKGLFLGGITYDEMSGLFHEGEFLLQKGTVLELEKAEIIDDIWHFKAKVAKEN